MRSSLPATMNHEMAQLGRSVMRKLITTTEAPVGHRQPQADQVPSEKNLMGDPNDPINRENAALDRMTKGICRGC